MRLVGDDGDDVPVGDAGEIWVRGDNVFHGYFEEPEATERVLVDGWLRTGDIGTVDDDGYLYLVDRAKDLIIVSGFNVFPAEVEEVLSSRIRRSPRSGCSVCRTRTTARRSRRSSCSLDGAGRRRGQPDRLRPRLPRPLQVPVEGALRRPAPAQRLRQARASRARGHRSSAPDAVGRRPATPVIRGGHRRGTLRIPRRGLCESVHKGSRLIGDAPTSHASHGFPRPRSRGFPSTCRS